MLFEARVDRPHFTTTSNKPNDLNIDTFKMGVPDFIFREPVPSYLRCTLCMQVADMPVQCPSCLNDLYCKKCFEEYIFEQKQNKCPAASCQRKWTMDQLKLNNKFHEMVNNLPAKCAVEQCEHTGTLLSTMVHFDTCPYKVVKCVNAEKGCKKTMLFKELQEHLQNECEHAHIICECGTEVPKKDIQVCCIANTNNVET
jgi:hypothetical protein